MNFPKLRVFLYEFVVEARFIFSTARLVVELLPGHTLEFCCHSSPSLDIVFCEVLELLKKEEKPEIKLNVLAIR